MTTHEAAHYLGWVQHERFLEILERGDIPCHVVDGERRLYVSDVEVYRTAQHEREMKALAEITALGEDSYLIDATANLRALYPDRYGDPNETPE